MPLLTASAPPSQALQRAHSPMQTSKSMEVLSLPSNDLLERHPCPHCSRRIVPHLLPQHRALCPQRAKGPLPLQQPPSTSAPAPATAPTGRLQPDPVDAPLRVSSSPGGATSPPVRVLGPSLAPCPHCGRSFQMERLAYHESVCAMRGDRRGWDKRGVHASTEVQRARVQIRQVSVRVPGRGRAGGRSSGSESEAGTGTAKPRMSGSVVRRPQVLWSCLLPLLWAFEG